MTEVVVLSSAALGVSTGTNAWSWTPDDCLLYALALGAGTELLDFTTENSEGKPQRVLPTFAAIAGGPFDATRAVPGIDWDRAVLHGEQRIEIFQPLTPAGEVATTSVVTGLRPTRSGVAVTTTTTSVDRATGLPWFSNSGTAIVVDGRLDGSEVGTALRLEPLPDDRPTAQFDIATERRQALVYRLCGDRNPLHSDPSFARRAGFPRPILHGLCTFGVVGLALLETIGAHGAESLSTMDSRFVRPVFPGEALTVRVWVRAPGAAAFGVWNDSGQQVIDRGSVVFRQSEADE